VENIFFFLTRPLTRVEVPGLTLIGTAVIEAFFTKMKVALIAGLITALPVVLWQAWRFIAPGLFEHEKRPARSFAFFGDLVFFLGRFFSCWGRGFATALSSIWDSTSYSGAMRRSKCGPRSA